MVRAALVTAVVAVAACRAPPWPAPVPEAEVLTGIVAHRGASHEAPENTLAAIERAWELGAEAVEIDVRVSRDGHVVLMHDVTTERTGGLDRAVAERTLAELHALDVGAWKHERFRGERVPTLEEALSTVPAARTLFVEVKSGVETVPAVASAIRAADPSPRGGAVALQAYDAEVLAALARLLPSVPAYWTLDPPVDHEGVRHDYRPGLAADARQRGFAGLALDYRAVGDDLLEAAAKIGVEVDVWTINDAGAIAAWRSRVRWVETDRPELLRRQ